MLYFNNFCFVFIHIIASIWRHTVSVVVLINCNYQNFESTVCSRFGFCFTAASFADYPRPKPRCRPVRSPNGRALRLQSAAGKNNIYLVHPGRTVCLFKGIGNYLRVRVHFVIRHWVWTFNDPAKI